MPDLQEWKTEVERLLRGAPFAKKMFTRTLEGITVGPMYTAADTRDLPWSEHLPGRPPFVRGAWPTGSRKGGWLVVQDLPYPTVEEFNNALRHDLKRGQNAVMLKLDRAAQLGLDPDQASPDQVGRDGTSVASLQELQVALDGIDLESVPFAFEPGSSALPVAALLVAMLQKQGKDPALLRACLGSDPLYGLASVGGLPVEMDQIFDELAILTRWAREKAPGVVTLPVNEIPYHEGGADSALSLGLSLAAAVEVLRRMEERGLEPHEVAPHMLFRMVVGTDFLHGNRQDQGPALAVGRHHGGRRRFGRGRSAQGARPYQPALPDPQGCPREHAAGHHHGHVRGAGRGRVPERQPLRRGGQRA